MPFTPTEPQQKPGRFIPSDSYTPPPPAEPPSDDIAVPASRHTFETRTTPRITQISDRNQGMLKRLWDDARVAKLFITSSSADEFARGYNRIYPGSEAITDEAGNMFIVNSATGEMGQVNKPGADFTDVLKFSSEVAKYTGATQPAGWLGKALVAGTISTANELLSEDFQLGQVALESALAPAGHFVGMFPPAVRKSTAAMAAFDGLKKQNKRLAQTVEDWLVTKADDVSATSTPRRVREAANKAYSDHMRSLQAAAKPIYEKANKTPLSDVNLEGVGRIYHSIQRKYGEGTGFRDVADKAMRVIRNAKTFEQLNGAKKELDSMIRPPQVGEKGYTREQRAVLRDIQNALVKAMDKASPSYKKARNIYSEGITEANIISEGVAGRLARIKDTNIEDMGKTLFSQNPRDIKRVGTILEKAQPGIMEDLAYVELRDRFARAIRLSPDELADDPSVIGKILFPKGKSEGLMSALPDDTAKALRKFDWLMRQTEKLKPDARRDVIGQGLWAKLGFPYRLAKKEAAKAGIYQGQIESIAVLEALTSRESLNSSLMKRFVATPFKGEKGVRDALYLLTQMSDEIRTASQAEKEAPAQ